MQYQLNTNLEEVDSLRETLGKKYLYNFKDVKGKIDKTCFDFILAEKKINNLITKIDSQEKAISYNSAMGILFASKGDYDKAKYYYQKVMQLVPKFGDHFVNYNTILIKSSDFEAAKKDLEDYFCAGNNNYELLFNLYYCGRWDLDFSVFKKYYEKVRHKDVLSESTKKYLNTIYNYIDQWKHLETELESIGVNINIYSEFYKILNKYHDNHIYNALDIYFDIHDDDDQCLVIDAYDNISDSEAVLLTKDFEKYVLEYAVNNRKMELLSKFLVFFRGRSIFNQDEYNGIFLRQKYEVG